jgi:hypothetical protein
MPPKPPLKNNQRYWFASHRVRTDNPAVWQVNAWDNRTGERAWVPVAYQDVPDELWSQRFTRDGWRFYTDRARECDERGFPVKKST